MTDREALSKAQNELDTSSYLAEVTLNKGMQKVHQNRIEWLARVLRLARKALYIEENQKQLKTNADRIRAMSDEEFVKMLGHNSLCDYVQDHSGKYCEKHGSCDGCLIEWLKQPAEGTE